MNMNGPQQFMQIHSNRVKMIPPLYLPMRAQKPKQKRRKRKAIDVYFLLPCLSAICFLTPTAFAFSLHSFSTTTFAATHTKLLHCRPQTHHHLYSSQSRSGGIPEPSKRKRFESTLSNFSQRTLTAIHSSPWLQLITVFVFYTVHLVYLTQGQLVFPIQWWASLNSSKEWRAYRHFVGIGYDSLAGIATLALYYKRFRSHATQRPPVLVPKTMPWKFPPAPPSPSSPSDGAANTSHLLEAIRSQYSWPHVVHRATFLLTTICLVTAYFATGRFSLYWQDILYELSAKGFPFTTPQFRAWSVLLGHLSWVGVGSGLLYLMPFAPRFFRRQVDSREIAASNVSDENEKTLSKPWHWFRFQFRKPSNGKSVWVWWCVFIFPMCFRFSLFG